MCLKSSSQKQLLPGGEGLGEQSSNCPLRRKVLLIREGDLDRCYLESTGSHLESLSNSETGSLQGIEILRMGSRKSSGQKPGCAFSTSTNKPCPVVGAQGSVV